MVSIHVHDQPMHMLLNIAEQYIVTSPLWVTGPTKPFGGHLVHRTTCAGRDQLHTAVSVREYLLWIHRKLVLRAYQRQE